MTAQASEQDFSSLDQCVYMRRATADDDVSGWVLFDADGDVVLFSESRNVIWFHITTHDLTHRWLN